MSTRASPSRARRALGALAAVAALVALGFAVAATRFPSDRTPEGAYLRVTKAVSKDAPEEFFAYLEEPAQHACYTIRDYRRRSLELARRAYPPAELAKLEKSWGARAEAPDGADVFAWYAHEEGWLVQLRRDLSGIARVEIAGERATVHTSRGTRYSLRRRPNGIWGLTAFTATLVDEAERAARDHSLVERASEDYARSGGRRAE